MVKKKFVTTSIIGQTEGATSLFVIQELYDLIQQRYNEMVVEYNKKDDKFYKHLNSHSVFDKVYKKGIRLTNKYDVKFDNRDLCSVYYIKNSLCSKDSDQILAFQDHLYNAYEENDHQAKELISNIVTTVIQRKKEVDENAAKEKIRTKLAQKDPALQFINSFRTKNK